MPRRRDRRPASAFAGPTCTTTTLRPFQRVHGPYRWRFPNVFPNMNARKSKGLAPFES